MDIVELIQKARSEGYRFLFIGDTEAVFFKDNPPMLGERQTGFYAGCSMDAVTRYHLLGEVLARRLPISWDGND